MTLKNLTLSTAIATLIAAPVFAESHATETEEMSTETEMTVQEGMTDDGTTEAESLDADMTDADMEEPETDAAGTDMEAGSEMDTDTETGLEDTAIGEPMTDPEMEPDTMESDGNAVIEPMEPVTYESLESLTIDEFLGLIVYSPDDERIGDIDYVVMGEPEAMGVIGIGGFLSLGEYTVAIPLSEFELGPDGDRLILGADKESLKQLPEFDETGVDGLSGDVPLSTLMNES